MTTGLAAGALVLVDVAEGGADGGTSAAAGLFFALPDPGSALVTLRITSSWVLKPSVETTSIQPEVPLGPVGPTFSGSTVTCQLRFVGSSLTGVTVSHSSSLLEALNEAELWPPLSRKICSWGLGVPAFQVKVSLSGCKAGVLAILGADQANMMSAVTAKPTTKTKPTIAQGKDFFSFSAKMALEPLRFPLA